MVLPFARAATGLFSRSLEMQTIKRIGLPAKQDQDASSDGEDRHDDG